MFEPTTERKLSKFTCAFLSLIVIPASFGHQFDPGGVRVDRCYLTGPGDAVVKHGATGVTVQLDAHVSTHPGSDANVDGMGFSHTLQAVVHVTSKTMLRGI